MRWEDVLPLMQVPAVVDPGERVGCRGWVEGDVRDLVLRLGPVDEPE